MTKAQRQILIREKELIEENYFKKYAQIKQIHKYRFSHTRCSYDVSMLSGTSYIIAENKTRLDVTNELVLKHGPFLELKKIEGMQAERDRIEQEFNIKPLMFYINYVKDAIQLFRLKEKHQYDFFWKLLPKDNITPEILEYKMVTKLFGVEEIILL